MGLFDSIFKGSGETAAFKKQLKNVLGFPPGNTDLYKTALTHRSVKDGAADNNERLEYLGDAILSGIVADFLFKKYPYREEGFLTEMRSKMVNRATLNDVAIKMGLKKIVYFNKFDNSLKVSQIFGNTLEAVVGAVYLDKGFRATHTWVLKRIILPYMFMDDLENLEINHKNKLYGWANSSDGFSLLIWDRDIEFLFEFHDQFYCIQRVSSQVIGERSFVSHFCFVYS